MSDNSFNFDDMNLDEELEGVQLEDDAEFDDAEFDDAEFENEESESIEVGELIDEGSESSILGENTSESFNFDADIGDGTPIDEAELHDDESDDHFNINERDEFSSDPANIVIQKIDDDETGFGFTYVEIGDIAITPRIRQMKSVDGLVQSIKSTGLLHPVVVGQTATEGFYVLLDGFRRLQACARAGMKKIPCVINYNIKTPDIPIIESIYNHSQRYSIKEQIDYIGYLENEKGIMNPAMIEYLLQMNNGDYTKLKDILNDNDDDIVTKLYDGVYDIATAFRKLEQRRKKETAEEKENKKAARVYEDEKASGADQIEGSGEEADDEALTEEEIQQLNISVNASNFDEDIDDSSIGEMIEEDSNLEGFKPHKQKVGEREYIDDATKKAAIIRDSGACVCCKSGGPSYAKTLEFHHIVPVFLGGNDGLDNGITVCPTCHQLIHLYSTGEMPLDTTLLNNSYNDLTDEQKLNYESEDRFQQEKDRFKRIIRLGSVIRQGIAKRGLNKEQYKKDHPSSKVGRKMPGAAQEMA